MSKKPFKASASSGRAVAGFGGFGGSTASQSSVLSYIQEPLDLQSISDSRIVVVFKNLLKRDDTTKAKALDDLQVAVDELDDLEDGILESWIRLFPRLSIDNSRRVRQLALSVNGRICSKAGKRTAKYMPQIAGPWLAAQHDNDRAVSRAAQDALHFVFSDAAKVAALRKVYNQAILDYCKNAIMQETVSSLSDTRVVSQEDADNTYARVVSSNLALITSLLSDSDEAERTKHANLYAEILEKKTLEFSNHTVAGVRRATHRLLRIAAIKMEVVVNEQLAAISDIYIYKGLRSDQTASSLDYTTTLVILTQHYPTIWTASYSGKKTAASRISHFLKQGSQGSTPNFWKQLSQLITSLPLAILPASSEEANELLSATRKGVSRKEDRFHAVEAWQVYKVLLERLLSTVEQSVKTSILEQNLSPLVRQYLYPATDATEWSVGSAKAASVVASLVNVQSFGTVLTAILPELSKQLIEQMRSSQPEQAKDHDKSQAQVAATGERWATLQRELFRLKDSDTTTTAAFASEDVQIITEALQLCSLRNGKPYGAAATVDVLLRDCGSELVRQDDVRRLLKSFNNSQLPALLFTASSSYLLRCLSVLHNEADFLDLSKKTLTSILSSNELIDEKAQLIITLFSQKTSEEVLTDAVNSTELQQFIQEIPQQQTATNTGLFAKLLKTGIVAHQTQLHCIKQLVQNLYHQDTTANALRQLSDLTAMHRNVLVEYDTDPTAANDHLISNLLRLTESEDSAIATLAEGVSSKLSLVNGNSAEKDRLVVIRHSLEDVGPASSSIDILAELAQKLLGHDSPAQSFVSCFPDVKTWTAELSALLVGPPSSMSICSPFGGAVYLVRPVKVDNTPEYAVDGFSKALRTSILFMKLMHTTNLPQLIKDSAEPEATTLYDMLVLALTTIIAAEDKVSISSANKLWLDSPLTESELFIFTSESFENLSHLVSRLEQSRFEALLEASAKLQASPTSPVTYYLALAKARLISVNTGLHKTSAKDISTKDLIKHLAQDPFNSLAVLISLTQVSADKTNILRIVNELITDLTELDFASNLESGQLSLLALNTILKNDDTAIHRVAKQRLIFLMKHLLVELGQTQSRLMGEEILRVLGFVLPALPDLYGEHWSQVLDNVIQTWTSVSTGQSGSEHIPTLYHALRLYAAMRKMTTQEDINEDLVDAIKERESEIANALLALLITSNNTPESDDYPLMITNELLARQISALSSRPAVEVADLLPLFYSPSPSIQGATFSLLHEHIPKVQEKVSFDAALENKVARLPDELLSMLLEAPNSDDFDETAFDRSIPASLLGYLYSWRLLFDYFDGSSYKVKTDYSEQLKDGVYLARLLNLTFDFLGHTTGKPIDVSGHDIVRYQTDLEPDAERNARWLLSHLYYRALLNLPSLVKGYVLEMRARQTPAVIEEWTAKHISPSIITASLQAVSEWSEKTVDEDPEYEKMTVKVGTRSKEVNVSYIVDEQTMAIKIILPEAYPLAPAQVVGVSRVAVKEEKWQSWLRNCQGVITFSNGSITDGLAAWRRNVTGALKGQTECAICYSIISADKQLPTKKCPTCKNLFHSSCLFKWFKTSNASTCPLCRNSFNFN